MLQIKLEDGWSAIGSVKETIKELVKCVESEAKKEKLSVGGVKSVADLHVLFQNHII